VIAATIFAGLDGIARTLEPPDPIEGDAYTIDPAIQGEPLPLTLASSLTALEADETIREAVGAETIDTFLAIKGFELDRFRAHTTDWELNEYMHHL
jgi:glutamine synthetase